MVLNLHKRFDSLEVDAVKTRLQAFLDFVDTRARTLRQHPVFVVHYDYEALSFCNSRDMRIEACKRYMQGAKESSLTRGYASDIRRVLNDRSEGLMNEVLEELNIDCLEDWLNQKTIKVKENVAFLGASPTP